MQFCIQYFTTATDEKPAQRKVYYFWTDDVSGHDELNTLFFQAAYTALQKTRPELYKTERTSLAWAMACQLRAQFDQKTGLTETPELCGRCQMTIA